MKRKIISTFLAITGISIIGFAILYLLGLFQVQDAGILIESDPVSKVYINNKEVGITPYEANSKPGEITIKIVPNIIEGVVLDDYETKVTLISGIRTIIKRVITSEDEDSSGAVVSFEKIGGEDSSVTVVSVPDNAQALIDGKSYGYTPLRIKVPAGDHKLTIISDGYLEKTLPIKVYKGYKLTASVKLARQRDLPVPENISIQNVITTKIQINKTDAGFLRVRSGASTGFPEVAQVKSDEVYDLIEEGENGGWYKIKVGDIEGWVSSEFSTKI